MFSTLYIRCANNYKHINLYSFHLSLFHQVNAHWGDVKLEDVLDPEPRAVAAFFEPLEGIA